MGTTLGSKYNDNNININNNTNTNDDDDIMGTWVGGRGACLKEASNLPLHVDLYIIMLTW